MKRILLTILAIILLLPQTGLANTSYALPVLKSSTPITAGAVLKEYDWDTRSGSVNVQLVEVDLTNPHVKVDVIPGGGQLTQRLNVSAMAKNTGAIAAINGDFFNTQGEGVPLGPMVIDGQIAASSAYLDGIFALGITTERKAYIEPFSFQGRVSSTDGAVFELSGINKTVYWEEPHGTHSHANRLHLYNEFWGGVTRGHDTYTTPTEILVKDGVVVDISPGKFFDFSVPKGSYILRGHGTAARFLVDNFSIGDPIRVDYSKTPDKSWSMVVGGHALLVDQGKSIPYSRSTSALDGLRARSAVGVSRDGKTLYIVGVEGKTSKSVGLSLINLSLFFEHIGAWRAMNLDGGGSTTMLARSLGDFQAARLFSPEQSTERMVVNALGVFTTAPKGQLKGFLIGGNEVVLINEQVEYALKAYDDFYNPMDVSTLSVKWNQSKPLGSLINGVFTAAESGRTEIKASLNSAEVSLPVHIVGRMDVKRMTLTTSSQMQGRSSGVMPLQLVMETTEGVIREVPAHLVDWQLHGISGTVSSQGVLTMQSVSAPIGFVVARYQGFSAPLAIFVEPRTMVDGGTVQNMRFEGTENASGSVAVQADPIEPTRQVVKLAYDFSRTTGTAAAYAAYPGDGLRIDETNTKLAVSIYGTGGNEWLRAELISPDGTMHRIDVSERVDWNGWKTIQLDTSAYAKPLLLKRIYVVVPENQRNQRSLTGELLIGGFSGVAGPQQEGTRPEAQKQAKSMRLVVGEKTLSINGNTLLMDVAPVVVEGRTLVPVRFISQALDAEVLWDAQQRNVTVIEGHRWMDLWPDASMMVVDGKAIALDVAPKLIQGRTMLPLRAVAESLDLQVEWEAATQTIRLMQR